MRVPLSWLREYAPLPEPVDATEVARRLTAAGLEVEALEPVGQDIRGVVVAQVLTIEELTGLKKPIRYCRVAVSDAQLSGPPEEAVRGHLRRGQLQRSATGWRSRCRARSCPAGSRSARARTYGRISEGMICAAGELAIGEDHTGIMVLPPDAPLGADFVAYAGLRDEVLEIAVTPDRGYAVSVRGHRPRAGQRIQRALHRPGLGRRCPMRTPGCGGDIDVVGPDVYPARDRATRPAATGSCCARCGASPRRPARRCGCGCGWPGAACGRCRSPST